MPPYGGIIRSMKKYRLGDPVISGESVALSSGAQPSNPKSHDPVGREEVGKQSVASGFPGNTYPLHENNCGVNGGHHRGTRALKVTFSTKEPSLCAPISYTFLKRRQGI